MSLREGCQQKFEKTDLSQVKSACQTKKMIYNIKSCNLFPSLYVLEAKEVKHMDSGKDIREAVIKYSNTLYKVCIVILCNEQDV